MAYFLLYRKTAVAVSGTAVKLEFIKSEKAKAEKEIRRKEK